jgi:hypothetical protein
MKKPLRILILLLMLGLVAYWLLHGAMDRLESVPVQMPSKTLAIENTKSVRPLQQATPTATGQPVNKEASGADDPTGNHRRRAYMLSLDKGALTLLEAQDIEGDFAPRRGRAEIWTGMLRCRLMSARNVRLAEEVLPAPDYVCAVLDARSGSDKPVKYTAEGPVVFQVRMPRMKEAARLDIFRIVNPGSSALEPLIGSIPLTPP